MIMNIKIITCVTCPVGCEMTIESEDKKLISVSGHTCKKGEQYASDEITNPRRVLTSTVTVDFKSAKLKLMPVKTDKPIAKDKIFEAMKKINKIKIDMPVKMGDILCSDFTESGINLVAGRDI
jgi:CxxC motif-containing protein